MKIIAPTDRTMSIPFRIGDGPSEDGARLGGTAPEGISSPLLRPNARYFMTFPLATEPPLFASLFVNCSFTELIKAMNNGVQNDDRIILIVHSPCPRGTGSAYASAISSHPLLVGSPQSDTFIEDGEWMLEPHHKFGGNPFCIQEPELPGMAELFEQDYIQVVQIDFPNRNDGDVDGDWPFMDGVFNVFWKPPFTGVPYYWYLQK